MCEHHSEISVNQILRYDPTKSTTLRNQFVAAFTKRHRSLKSTIKRNIIDLDIFGMRPNNISVFQDLPPNKFKFVSDAEKVALFMEWFKKQVREEIFEMYDYDPALVTGGNWWVDFYVRKGYEKGINHSSNGLRSIVGSSSILSVENTMQIPFHVDRLGLLYVRNYELLEGITTDMSKAISEVLANGIGQGWGVEKIANSLNSRIDAIGLHRSRLLARTEVIRAHAEATLNNFESFGIHDVRLLAEFSTASHGVCEICKPKEGNLYTLEEARGVIPVHPGCRCAWIPYSSETKEILGEKFI
jgi:SPP1 gp7 family putative phage head morphogenesis protein